MVSEEFKKNVESGDVVAIRSALVDYLIIDTSFRRFDEALDYAKQLIDVIEPDDGKADYDLVQEHWNETYLNKQKVALMINFSQKRIDHIKLVVKTVLVDKPHGVQNSDAVKELPQAKERSNKTGKTVLSVKTIPHSEGSTKASMDAKTNIQKHKKFRIKKSKGEKSDSVKKIEEEVHPVDIAVWMIGGGITAVALGGLTAGIGAIAEETVAIHIGAAIAGTGGVVAVSGGVIKIVKEM